MLNITEIHVKNIPEKCIQIICTSSDIKTNSEIKQNIVKNYNIHYKCIDKNNFDEGEVGLLSVKPRTIYYMVTKKNHDDKPSYSQFFKLFIL